MRKMLLFLGCFLVGLVHAEDTVNKTFRKASAMKPFFPGKEFFMDSVSIAGRWAVVFEDDGTTGYLYAMDLEEQNQGMQPIQEAMQIYNAANVTDAKKESVAAIVWSEDGAKACLLINGHPHAIFDFAAQRGYCRTNFPKPGKWKTHDFAWDDNAMEPFLQKEASKPVGTEKLRTDLSGNPILDQFSEEGFLDCVFRISNLTEDAEFFSFHLSASCDDTLLGINVKVRKDIKGGLDAETNLIKDHVYRDGVVFIRSGEESDRLIARLASLYGFPSAKIEMIPLERFTAIALHQGPIDLRTQVIKIKIFGRDQEPFDEDAYYESFFNVDLPNGFVYWNEKDQAYRKPLIDGLKNDRGKCKSLPLRHW